MASRAALDDEKKTPRRPKGEGSLRQVRNGYWEAMLDLGWADGKRVRPTFRGRTKAEAIAKRKEAEQSLSRGEPILNNTITVSQLCDQWLESKVETKVALGSLKESTAQNYRDACNVYVKPVLGRKQVRSLRTADVDAMSARMRKAGLSQNTIRVARSTLRMALGFAITERVIAFNVVDGSVRPNVSTSADQHVTLSVKQAKHLLAHAPDDVYGSVVRLALWTGMREGELAGLLWEDVDLKAKRLKVTGTVHRLTGKGLVRTDPKTEASKAPIPLPPATIQLLRRQQRQQSSQRATAGDQWLERGFVFTNSVGGPLEGRKILREWHKMHQDLGLPQMTVHDLRHTTGTLLRNAGVPLDVVSAILRHSSIRVTRDVYTKIEEPLSREGMNVYGELLGRRRAN